MELVSFLGDSLLRGLNALRRLIVVLGLSFAGHGMAQDAVDSSTGAKRETSSNPQNSTPAGEVSKKKSARKTQKPGKGNNPPKDASAKDGSANDVPQPTKENSAGASAADSNITPSSAKGVVKGIIDGKIRFDSKEFTDIAVGQIFIVEGKTPGQLAARIETTQVSKNKKLAAAKIAKLEPEFQVTDLLNLAVYRERDFNARYGDSKVTAFVAPEAIVGRNNMLGIQLHVLNNIPPAANLITGVELNQAMTSIGAGFEFFLPHANFGTTLNRIGLKATYLQTIPIEIIGRVNGSDETQTLQTNAKNIKFGIIFRARSASGSLAEYWASAGYEIINTNAKIATNTGAGSTDIKFSQKGPEFAAGGDFSPLPFLYLGSDVNIGIPQKYTSSDTANDSARSGKWNQIRAAVYGELRYPTGKVRRNLLSLQLKGGVSSDSIEVKKNGAKVNESYLAPFFAVRLGYAIQ